MKVRLVFPELENPIIARAVQECTAAFGNEFEPVQAANLSEACAKLKAGEADGIVAGIDYTSREVILNQSGLYTVKYTAKDKNGKISKKR